MSNTPSEDRMDICINQLARRPLNLTCPSVGVSGVSYQRYSHATDPQRSNQDVAMNGHVAPPTQIASSSCTVTQSLKREREVDSAKVHTPPPSRKRMRLSLSRDRSRTPSWSVCSSGGSSPCSSQGGGSLHGDQQSSTPPLSPINDTTESHELAASESPISRSKAKVECATSKPHVKMEPKDSPLATNDASNQPTTPRKITLCHDNDDEDDFDITPPLKKVAAHGERSPRVNHLDDNLEERKPGARLYDSPSTSSSGQVLARECHCQDMSAWGGGRLAYSCDLTSCRPFDKFSQGHLENYAEMISKGSDLENYLQILEQLVNQGLFIPTKKIDEVFRVMRKCNNDQAIKGFHFCLQQDVSIRTDASMKSSEFWSKLQKCLDALRSNRKVLVASVQLSYLSKFLVKNLDANKDEPRSSLVEQLLSSKKSLNISSILDVIFSLQARTADGVTSSVSGDLCPLRCLMEMICLPLLTCDPSSRPELRTKLAREFAMRLGQLAPCSSQLQLINGIPSNYLKEKVLDFVLERKFPLPPNSSAVDAKFSDNDVSIVKITAVHLHRRPDTSPHSLSFFLSLLTSLIQTHLLTVSGSQPLVSLLPSSSPLLTKQLLATNGLPSTMEGGAVQEALFDMYTGVLQLTERLTQDERYIEEMTEPTTWFQLQLLSLITSR